MRGFVCFFDFLCEMVIRITCEPKAVAQMSDKQYIKDCVRYRANMEYLTEYPEYTTDRLHELLDRMGACLFPGLDKRPKYASSLTSAQSALVNEMRKIINILYAPEGVEYASTYYGAQAVDYYLKAAEDANRSQLAAARQYYSQFVESVRKRTPVVRDKAGNILLKRAPRPSSCYFTVTPEDVKARLCKPKKVYEEIAGSPGFADAEKLSANQHVDVPYKSKKKPKYKVQKQKRTKPARKRRGPGGGIAALLGIIALPFVKLGKGIFALLTAIWSGLCHFTRGVGKLLSKPVRAIGSLLKSARGRDDGGLSAVCLVCALVAGLYVVLELTGLIYKMTFSVGDLMLAEFYHFNLTRLFVSWLKAVDHTFLTAITLGLVQIILIALGAICDVVIYIVLFLVSILIMIVLILAQLIYVFALPVAACIVAIIKFIRSRNKSVSAALLMLAAIVGTVLYFVGIVPML